MSPPSSLRDTLKPGKLNGFNSLANQGKPLKLYIYGVTCHSSIIERHTPTRQSGNTWNTGPGISKTKTLSMVQSSLNVGERTSPERTYYD